ncbi:hypothetical protein ACQPZP_40680 [Spirillospora sp. CA-142024]|uniref:hypothetical protein n=1 Tax=Spirillospora sp. CA-142024 TaxID=3240036 RepID=UPI003D8BA16B
METHAEPQRPDRSFLDEFGDLDSAIEMVRVLNEEVEEPPSMDEFLREFQPFLATDQGVDDLRTGCMTLIYFLFNSMGLDEAPLNFVPAVVRKLGEIQGVSTDVLPMIAGGLTATFLQQEPREWRERYGSVPPEESLAWIYATWAMVNFIDFLKEEKGAALRDLTELIHKVIEGEAE